MHWFFALTEDSTAFREYADMIMVAVHTARKFTSLVSHCLYDGGDNDFTQWLTQHDVRIVRHRSFLRDDLAKLGRRKNNPHFAAALSGAFSRVELPGLMASSDGATRVLYTDCDVIFLGEVVPELEANPCEYFAVAPEGQQDDYVNMNTGVMLMNTERCGKVYRNFASIFDKTWPSSSVNRGTKQPTAGSIEIVMGRSGTGRDRNWKPYWGWNPQARIIHFHGPKPYQRSCLDSVFPELKYLTSGSYYELCEQWSELLAAASIH